MNYYNEFDPKAAAWLRSLISAKLIPDGVVDERSIMEVQPADLVGYVQCHFFAGIGGWPQALQLAGWPASRRVWTGSCPCQPFSTAGKRKGKEDERHLWPVWFELLRRYNTISQREPVPVFGEQVASAIRHGWLDGVCTDMEGEGYAVGHAVLGAHSVGAPHIRQRLYWVGVPNCGRWPKGWLTPKATGYRSAVKPAGSNGGLGISDSEWVRDQGCGSDDGQTRTAEVNGQERERIRNDIVDADGLGNSNHTGLSERISVSRVQPKAMGPHQGEAIVSGSNVIGLGFPHSSGCGQDHSQIEAGNTTSTPFWSHFDLIPCRDGKARRVKSGVRCLAHGVQGRVAQLRGLGNAIVPQVAAEFIAAFMEVAQ